MSDEAFEDLMLLQDILDEVVSGRTAGHKCPWCNKAELTCEADEARVRLECTGCGKTFDGRLM